MGFILRLSVHGADIQDRDGGLNLLGQAIEEEFTALRHLWVDSAYAGIFVDYVTTMLGWTVDVVRRWKGGPDEVWVAEGEEVPPRPTGFQVQAWRWIVERTFGWMGRYRRLSKDYEHLTNSAETWIYIAMVSLMRYRLTSL